MTAHLAPPSGRLLRVGRLSIVLHPRVALTTAIVALAALAAGVVALTVGTASLTIGEAIGALAGSGEPMHVKVVQGIRLPRVVTALLAGVALGASGAVFQSVSRNALGSPEIIGFTTGAATGAIVQIVVFQAGSVQVAIGAFVGGIVTALVVYLLAVRGGVTGGYRLILVGIGAGAVLQAVNGLLLVMGDLDQAVQANLWLSGSLDARGWEHAIPVGVACVVVLPVIALLGRRATLAEMGDDLAAQLGVRVERVRVVLIFCGVLLAAAATAACGPIAFVALAAPQLVQRLSRGSGVPIVGAAAMGACLLVVSDLAAQILPIDAVVPIGRVTGIIGGLYLIWLLTRKGTVRV
ncbi:FecCD family ABC transporter permease [Microbacterium sp. gxy059]|uniref:FecCD family ABC transporter permease n=1 Tax=Microbacterium sp. gxy059 TaxID=2957199 RepID=UPI003D978AF7